MPFGVGSDFSRLNDCTCQSIWGMVAGLFIALILRASVMWGVNFWGLFMNPQLSVTILHCSARLSSACGQCFGPVQKTRARSNRPYWLIIICNCSKCMALAFLIRQSVDSTVPT